MKHFLLVLTSLLCIQPLAFVQAQQMVPEFTGLQPVDISQYVDPATGDFNFQTLLLEIPGSQGSYPILLNYRAGIGLNQPASWVGLGFNLEPGAIYRSISQVPDDYRRNKITVEEYDSGIDRRDDIPNWIQRQADEIGLASAKVSRNLNSNWHRGGASHTFKHIDELGIAAYNFSNSVSLPSALNDPIGFAVNTILLFTTFPKVGNTGFSSWDYNVIDKVDKKKIFFLTYDKDQITKIWLDKTTDQNAYGFLYEHDKITYRAESDKGYWLPSTFDDGSIPNIYSYNNPQVYDSNRSYDSANITSDYFQLVDTSRFENLAPTFSAPDAYRIASPLLSGELIPMRYDNVSLSSSNISNRYYDKRIATYTYALPTSERTQRPQFVFNDQSNRFSFFSEAIQQEDQGLQYEIKSIPQSTKTKLLDFLPQSSSLTEEVPTREGYDGAGILKQAVQVDWFTNEEINEGLAFEKGFIDYTADRARGFQDVANSATETPFPPKGIGGFTVTDKNGMRFHFALPVYEREMKHYSEFFVETFETTYESTTTYSHPFAKKWLLTAITGPDFVDDGSLPGYIDNFDHGYYVKFEYGKYSSNSYWRSPEQGAIQIPDNETFQSHTTGQEEQYFLNTIATSTHTALFVKKKRRDFLADTTNQKGNLLALKEIILLSNEDYQKLQDLKGGEWDLVNKYNKNFSKNVLKHEDIYDHDAITSLVQSSALRRVVLDHNYSLCRQAPNPAEGRLTLKGINLFGKKNTPVMNGFSFAYASNPDYYPLSYDAWGLYKNNQEEGKEAHLVESPTEGQAWSLTRIKTPNQQRIKITYGRDLYQRVAQFSTDAPIYGGDLRVDSIEQKDLVSGIRHRYAFDYRTGVTSSEPSFSLGEEYDLLSVYRYPQARVTYGEVEKKKVAGDEYLYKEVNTFGVMDSLTIQLDTLQFNRGVIVAPDDSSYAFITGGRVFQGQQLNEAVYHAQYRTDRIGQLQHQAVYDANNHLLQETTYQYEDSPLGYLSQAAHLLDHSYRNYVSPPTTKHKFDARMTYRFINTVSSYIPQRLTSVNTVDHTTNTVAKSRFLAHDFYTGEPLKSVTDDAYGNRLLSEKVPAYHKLTGMGLAVDGGTNQLAVPAANYAYQLEATEPLDSLTEEDLAPQGLIGATAQRWSAYQGNVWRPQASYRWTGQQELQTDGTHSYEHFTSNPFTWANATPPAAWEQQNEVLTYNPNGIPLASQDINRHTVASLDDPEEERVIASAAHAQPSEIAFSGAEYYARFGDIEGRVKKGEGTPSETHVHTGDYSLLLPSGSEGFEVTLKKNEGANLSRTYRASVWVYLPGEAETQAEMDQVELFYSINGNQQGSVSPVLQKNKSKSWYQLTLDFTPSAGVNQITIACRNGAQRSVYLDDIRVHPLEATMTSFIYDKASDEVTYVLDADNFYMHYEYDELGNRITTTKEFFYTVDQVISRNKIHYATPN